MKAAYKTIEQIRLENLKTLCAGFKSQRQFALFLGKSAQQVNRWLGTDVAEEVPDSNARTVSSAQAREIEGKCGKPCGWMDHEHTESQVTTDSYVSPMLEN